MAVDMLTQPGGDGPDLSIGDQTADAADLRINAGKTDEYYKQKADYFLYNNSDEKAFSKRFSDILKKIIVIVSKLVDI